MKSPKPRTTENEIEAVFHAERARVLSNQGSILAAISEYETVLNLDKKHEGAADKLVELYFTAAEKYAKGEADKEAYYKKAVEVAPESYRANFQMGVFYAELSEKKDYVKAAKYFKEALGMTGNKELALANLITCYQRIGDIENQIKHSELLMTINPQNPVAYFGIAFGYEFKAAELRVQGNNNKAKLLLEMALDYCKKGLEWATNPLEKEDLNRLKGNIERKLKEQ